MAKPVGTFVHGGEARRDSEVGGLDVAMYVAQLVHAGDGVQQVAPGFGCSQYHQSDSLEFFVHEASVANG